MADYEGVKVNSGISQRVILIAVNFRSEVTSTVMWLLNFNLQIQCMRVTPFAMNEDLFLNFEQIAPTPDAEEYMVGMVGKEQEDITQQKREKAHQTSQKAFRATLLPRMNSTRSALFRNISPQTSNWISAASGFRRVGFNFVASKSVGRVELYIGYGEKEDNERIFNELYS